MRVLGPIQTETSDSFTDSLLAFSVSYRPAWYGLGNGFRLITQRSVVQIHPPATNGIIELGEPRFRLPFFSVRVVCAFYWMAARLGIATTLSACAFFHSRRLLCTARCCARFSSSLNRSA